MAQTRVPLSVFMAAQAEPSPAQEIRVSLADFMAEPEPQPDFRTSNETDDQGQPVLAEHPHAKVGRWATDTAKGALSGLLSTAYHGGDLIRRGLGMERVIDTPEAQAAMTPPDTSAAKIGFYGEQIAEFASPAMRVSKALAGSRMATRMAAEGAVGAGIAAVQTGGDAGTMQGAGAIGAVLPPAAKVVGIGARAAQRAAHGAKDGGVGGAIAAVVRKVAPDEPKTLIVQAIKPRSTKVNFADSLDRSLPEIKAVEGALGKPIEGIDDLMEATALAKKQVRAQYDKLAGPKRAMGSTVDLTPVADAVESSIPYKTGLKEPGTAERLMGQADVYRRRFSLEDAEQILKETNAELDAFYGKYPAAQRAALASDPHVSALEAEAKALRDVIYKTLDNPGQGAAARELQRRYGSLMELEQEAMRRANVAKRQQPESLNEQISGARAVGEYAKGAWRLAHGDVTGAADIAGAKAMRSAATYIKEQQTTDALIKRAFASFKGKPAHIEMPPQLRIKGLLGKAPHTPEPPADTSYVRGVPAVVAQRNQRALPPASTIRTGPPAPDTSYVRGVPAEYARREVRGLLNAAPEPRKPAIELSGEVQTPPPDGSYVRGVKAEYGARVEAPAPTAETPAPAATSMQARNPERAKAEAPKPASALSDLSDADLQREAARLTKAKKSGNAYVHSQASVQLQKIETEISVRAFKKSSGTPPARPKVSTEPVSRSIDDAVPVKKQEISREHAFILRWLERDLSDMPYQAGGSTKGARNEAFRNRAPGESDSGIGVGSARVAGTPTLDLFHALGATGSRNAIATQIDHYLATGGRNQSAEAAKKLATVFERAWNPQKRVFEFDRVPEDMIKGLGIRQDKLSGPVTMSVDDQPQDLVRYFSPKTEKQRVRESVQFAKVAHERRAERTTAFNPEKLEKESATVRSDDPQAASGTREDVPAASPRIKETPPRSEAPAEADRVDAAASRIPPSRSYLKWEMRPSQMMTAYVEKTWGSTFGLSDLIDAVVRSAGKKGFVPGKPHHSKEATTLGEQKRAVLAWMDWNDAGLVQHEKEQARILGPRLGKDDILDTGEAQARIPGTDAARKVGKADISLKAPQQASDDGFSLAAPETPTAKAAREKAEAPPLFDDGPNITYFKGDKAEYTGKVETMYGRTWREVRLLEGHMKGQLKLVKSGAE
jgi:hypothetical protein